MSTTVRDSTLSLEPQAALSGGSLGLTPQARAPAEAWPGDDDPARRYRDAGVLARGGMGEVRIRFDHRLERRVAVKIPILDHPAARQLFVAEARLTAKLTHPGIVAVHDAGYLPDGRPYYTMPILEGRTLAEALASTPAAQRLRLVRHVLDACEAVAYAHREGIVHRDLKPANILVGRFGETVVLDWGLAGPIGRTAPGRVGTPRYMPPEQERCAALDARTDVFALGVTLREVVTGSTDAAITTGLTAELGAIIERATAADPDARYPDGRALADDLIAWFEGRRVAAHDYGLLELLARAWTAHRVPVLATVLTLAGVATATAIGYRRTADERARAQRSEAEAIAAYRHAADNLAQVEIAQALVAMDHHAWSDAELYAAAALVHAPSPHARGVLARFDEAARPQLSQRVELPACRHAVLSPSGHTVACSRGSDIAVGNVDAGWHALGELTSSGTPVAVSEGDPTVLVRELDGRITALDLFGTRAPVEFADLPGNPQRFRLRGRGASWISGVGEFWADLDRGRDALETTRLCLAHGVPSVTARYDDERVVLCQSGTMLRARATDTVATTVVEIAGDAGAPLSIAIDGELAAIGTTRAHILLVDMATQRIVHELVGDHGTPSDLALADGRLAVAHAGDRIDIWDVATGALVTGLASDALGVRWVDGGATLRTVGTAIEDFTMSATPWRPHVQHHESGIAAVTLSSRDEIVSAHGDGRVRVTPRTQVAAAMTLPLHWSVTKDIEASPDGRRVAAVSAQNDELRIFDLDDPLTVESLPARASARVVWLVGDHIVSAPYTGGLLQWRRGVAFEDASDTAVPRMFDLESDADRTAATAVDGRGDIYRLRADDGVPVLVAHLDGASSVAGSGDTVVAAGERRLEVFVDGVSQGVATLDVQEADVSLAPDARRVAVAHTDGSVSIWDVATLTPLARLLGHTGHLPSLAFSSDGAWLFSGGWDGDVRQWSLRSLERPAPELLRTIERAWGRSIDDVLRDRSGLRIAPAGL